MSDEKDNPDLTEREELLNTYAELLVQSQTRISVSMQGATAPTEKQPSVLWI